jgi:hypothetical protein
MNKTLMPALLVATIMVAGAFALMPVEQASTVHLTATTIAASIDAVNDVFIDASTGAVSISSGSEAADSVNGDISIDALLDVQIDAVSGIAVFAGSEATAQADGNVAIDALNDVWIDTASGGAVTIAAGSEATDTVAGDLGLDALNDVLMDALGGVAIFAGSEATGQATGNVAIDAVNDVWIDTAATGAVNIAAGSEATESTAGAMTLLAANAASVTSTASTVTVATTAAQDIVLDADVGATTGTVNIVGSGTASDILQLGNDTTPTSLQKTGANQLSIIATDLVLSADVIGSAEVVGSNTAAIAPIAIDVGTGTAISAVTSSYTPAVSSQAIVWCTWEGAADSAAITAGIVTLSTNGNGTIAGGAAHNFDESTATGDFLQATDVWSVTGITNASTFTCTLSGSGVADADIDNISVIAMVVPE